MTTASTGRRTNRPASLPPWAFCSAGSTPWRSAALAAGRGRAATPGLPAALALLVALAAALALLALAAGALAAAGRRARPRWRLAAGRRSALAACRPGRAAGAPPRRLIEQADRQRRR